MCGNKPQQLKQITLSTEFSELVMTKVRQALDEILLVTYKLEFDAFGQALLSELEYCCQRGLRVRCLIDAEGSKNFIKDHPDLFTKLETEIRIQHGQDGQNNRIVFDRELAVVGSHQLCEANLQTENTSWIITGAQAVEIADDVNVAWEKARSYTNVSMQPDTGSTS